MRFAHVRVHVHATRFLAFGLVAAVLTPLGAAEVAVSGQADPRLKSFDQLMRSFVAEHDVPGAALAVARDGRLVYARGFGRADAPVPPDALFRIASLSKPVTAATILSLVEEGTLRLDDHLLDRLAPELAPGGRPPTDPRWGKITLRELLEHRGGWDRDASFDPMFRAVPFAKEQGVAPPAGPTEVIRSMWTRPLDFDPGARYAYSNFGYCLLGRVIERAMGQPYGEAVANRLLRPLGISPDAMRLGRTLPDGRAPREVAYHDAARTGPSVFPPVGAPVPTPYGAWNLEAMDAHGGWIASAPALLRFAMALDAPARAKVLRPETVAAMFDRPPGAAGLDAKGQPRASYYALGWNVRPVRDRGRNTWHTGSLPGTSTLLVRRWDGLSWAVLFNTRDGQGGRVLSALIDPRLHDAADQVKEWPDVDLFADPAILGVAGN